MNIAMEMDPSELYCTFISPEEARQIHHGDDGLKMFAGSLFISHNIFLLPRTYRNHPMFEGFLSMARELSKGKVVFDTDDDLTGDTRDLGSGTRPNEFIAALREVDLVTVSTPYLQKRMQQYSSVPVIVLPNHVDVGWFASVSKSAERQFSDKLSIGMVGTSTHYGDWGYPVEALKRLSQELPGKISVTIAGYVPDYLAEIPDLHVFQPVPYERYPGLMRQYDIVLCSLDQDDDFNKSKSGVKALEAMAAARRVGDGIGGAVPICTDMPVYRRVVNNGQNGLLVDHDEWYDAIKDLIDNPSKRKRMARTGYQWVKKNRNLRNGGYRLWIDVYKELLDG